MDAAIKIPDGPSVTLGGKPRVFHDTVAPMHATKDILGYMSDTEFLAPDTDVSHGIMGPDNVATNFPHRVIYEHFPTFLSIINCDRINTLFQEFLGGEVLSLDHKWLRSVGHGLHTQSGQSQDHGRSPRGLVNLRNIANYGKT